MKDQMLSHICLRFKTEEMEQQQTLDGLPKAIRSSIAHYLFFPTVEKVYLFQGVSSNLILQLVSDIHFHQLIQNLESPASYVNISIIAYALTKVCWIGCRNKSRVFSTQGGRDIAEWSSNRSLYTCIRNSGWLYFWLLPNTKDKANFINGSNHQIKLSQMVILLSCRT